MSRKKFFMLNVILKRMQKEDDIVVKKQLEDAWWTVHEINEKYFKKGRFKKKERPYKFKSIN